ncbi:UNVERIFIED_CONTAM: hypothetical protein PYX00_000795 [Menopon gallinae]|uniref:VTT domain-containing protein n=1 Tax=Menopon gallinae TaxID=328185 RepID=A0AAW2I9Z7_9NEOP
MVKPFFLLFIIFASSAWLYVLHYFGPNLHDSDGKDRVSFPSNLNELKTVASTLQTYSINHWWYVFIIFSSAYIYKQAFCIPGSLFLNILAGALYGNVGGLLFACTFTATGASICYILSKTFARDLAISYFPQKIKDFEDKVNENGDRLFYFMLFLRLISVTPGWLINIAAPLVGIPLRVFYFSTLLGLGPYNFVGVSTGGMLSSLESVNDVFSWKTLLNISLIGLCALGPAFFIKSRNIKQNVKIP